MKALFIGYSINLKKIGESLIDKVDDLIFLNSEHFKFSSWSLFYNDKVTFFDGDEKKIDDLVNAGLEDSDIVIIDSGEDVESLFVAQKCKINLSSTIFLVLSDLSVSEIFDEMGFLILDSNNLNLDKIIKFIEKLK